MGILSLLLIATAKMITMITAAGVDKTAAKVVRIVPLGTLVVQN